MGTPETILIKKSKLIRFIFVVRYKSVFDL